MKKSLFLWALALMMTGAMCSCSKSDSDDGGNDAGIENTYADDDFLMTERNIREKLVGEWEVQELMTYDSKTGWTTKAASELGSLKNVTMKADGSCVFLGKEDAHWRVGKDTLVVSCLYLVGRFPEGSVTKEVSTQINSEVSKAYAESVIRENFPDATISYEQREAIRLRVTKMDKDGFAFREPDVTMATTMTMKRR